MRWRRFGSALLLALVASRAAWRLPVYILGRTHDGGPVPTVDAAAMALHSSTFVVDLHCDSLLGGRDLLSRSVDGHVDVPRLLEGQVGLAVFTIVTQFPWVPRQQGNAQHSLLPDAITGLAISQGWPQETWGSLQQRALYQAQEMHGFVARSKGKLTLITSQPELEHYIDERKARCPSGVNAAQRCDMTAALLGIEGLHALELTPESSVADMEARLLIMYDAGVRLLGLSHFIDNALSGSAHGEDPMKIGLSPLGARLVPLAEQMGFVLDLAHVSEPAMRTVLGLVTKPVVVSHTGLKRCVDSPRTLSDEMARLVAASGGVLGIGLWPKVQPSAKISAILETIHDAVELIGPDAVSIGSDFDGGVSIPRGLDAAGLASVRAHRSIIVLHRTRQVCYFTTRVDHRSLCVHLRLQVTAGLLRRGMDVSVVGRVMGGNALRVLRETLPSKREWH